MMVSIYIENNKIDLFKDENIEIVSSIMNASDISVNTTDYSKTFTVPASENNNRIFKHYWDADIDNSFDARTKIKGRIELDGFPYKFGNFRLEKASVKNNKVSNYTIQFWGNLTSLKDTLKNDELTSLDLSDFDHLVNTNNIIIGLTSSLFGGNVIYNLFSKRQMYYNSDITDVVNQEKLVNIANNGSTAIHGVRYNELRASIKLIKIIEAIESKYNLVFTRDFFGLDEFTKIFTWLNNSADVDSRETETLIEYNDGDGDDFGLNYTTHVWTNSTFYTNPTTFRFFQYRVRITPDANSLEIPYKIIVKNNGVEIARIEVQSGVFTTDYLNINSIQSTTFNLTFHLASNQPIGFESRLFLRRRQGTIPNLLDKESTSDASIIINTFEVSENLPKIKIIDFLKGLFNMFKLVVIPNDDNTILYIDTLKNYYANGKLRDVTKYIDFDTFDVERGKILNEINYKFEQPSTILNVQFTKNTGIPYGDEEFKLADENGIPLDGELADYKIPFEMFVYERLKNLNNNELTNLQYALILNESLENVNPKMHLFYNENVNINTTPIYLISQEGTNVSLNTTLNVPSHSIGFEEPIYNLLFGQEFSEWNGQLIENTLFSNYHKDYIESIFNIKRRSFKYTGIFPLALLLDIKLNDVLQIRNNYYRIDNYNINLLTRKIQLNLINSFDNQINT